MRELQSTPQFERAYRKFVRRHPALEKKIDEALKQIQLEVFAPSLQTHKLSGRLFGLSACSCGYNCRIVFTVEKLATTGQEIVLLIDIGTHDEVY